MSDYELQKARSTLLSCRSPSYRGGSLLAKTVLHVDPMADVSVAPAVSWAVAVWQALVAPERSLFSIRELNSMFLAVQERMEPHHRWRHTKGPISCMFLSLWRVGWQAKNFAPWEDDRGVDISPL